jgi:hypothetical protein
MNHRIATITAAALLFAGGATVASTASARDIFNVSIGLPGFAVGYANRGYYAPSPVVYAPPVAYAPEVAYYDAPVVYATAPIVYGPRIAYGRPFYRPFYHARYWHR